MNNKNEIKRVVGLKYDRSDALPHVVVKGSGEQAEAILKYHKSVRGPVLVEDKSLVDMLYKIPMDGEIGPELYELVAILLVHVYAVQEKVRGGNRA